MWPFKKKTKSEIKANSVEIVDGVAFIDVRGQTCPGYLLAINKAVEKLDAGMMAKLLITYPPCGEDVKAWCKEKRVSYLDITEENDRWVITIQKQG
ncbi:MAG: sulfurtransferase TusA family protein [Gammaproteobacteria bacterium]|nr:sulfurtransferase TusA family protein [Gammaproteobacteria bacterium]